MVIISFSNSNQVTLLDSVLFVKFKTKFQFDVQKLGTPGTEGHYFTYFYIYIYIYILLIVLHF